MQSASSASVLPFQRKWATPVFVIKSSACCVKRFEKAWEIQRRVSILFSLPDKKRKPCNMRASFVNWMRLRAASWKCFDRIGDGKTVPGGEADGLVCDFADSLISTTHFSVASTLLPIYTFMLCLRCGSLPTSRFLGRYLAHPATPPALSPLAPRRL